MSLRGRTSRLIALAALLLPQALVGTTASADTPTRPQRIVSTNYCTDQILLRLVEPARIASLSYLSWSPGDTPPEFQPALTRIKPNHGLAEEVLTLEPDLVVGGSYSARFASQLLGKLGYKVVVFQTETSFAEWYDRVREIGAAVGEPERAEKLIADFKARLAALQADIPPGEKPVYASLQIQNWMPGKDTLYTEVVNAGGFRTAGEYVGYSGYQEIPLEQLIQIPVDLISSGSKYESPPTLTTQSLRHPLLRRMVANAHAAIHIPPRYITCTTPETLDMVALLVKARHDVDAAKARETKKSNEAAARK